MSSQRSALDRSIPVISRFFPLFLREDQSSPFRKEPVCQGCLRQEMFATIRSKDVLLQWGTELTLRLWCIGSLHWKAGFHSVARRGPVLSVAQEV